MDKTKSWCNWRLAWDASYCRLSEPSFIEGLAIADTDPTRLLEIGDQFNIKNRYTDPDEMLQTEN